MKRVLLSLLAVGISVPAIVLGSCRRQRLVRRIGMVIGIRPDRVSAYETLHAASNPGVRNLLTKHHIHNFSIFLTEMEGGRYYLFGYYEYTGSNYEGDMEDLAADPRNQEWLRETDPMQVPLEGKHSWSIMREVYYNA